MKQTLTQTKEARFASFKAEMDRLLATCFSDSWEGYVDECVRLLNLGLDVDDDGTVFLGLSEQGDNLVTWDLEEVVSHYIETFVDGAALSLAEKRACLKVISSLEKQAKRVRKALKKTK